MTKQTRTIRGMNADGHIVEAVVEHDPEATAARKAARDAARPKIVQGLAFLQRFTLDEYKAVVTAAQSNSQLSLWIDMLRVNGEIDVNGNIAKAAKDGLVEAKLLTQERADVVFAH